MITDDIELARYYFPHCMMHWPDKWPEFAQEAREMLKTDKGRSSLESLRQEYEETLNNRRCIEEEGR